MRYNIEDGYALKSLIEQIFGRQAWYEIKHCEDLATWKKYSKRVLKAIKASIDSTVNITDTDWREEIDREIEFGLQLLHSSIELDVLFSNLSATLARVSFLQIGLIPDRGSRENVQARAGSNWNLNNYRSVQYVQTQGQIEAVRFKKQKKSHKK